jgi:ABC transporter substrate binding protein
VERLVAGVAVAVETNARLSKLFEYARATPCDRRRVAVIAALSNTIALAAKSATSTIPIVFGVGDDPVKLGLVASLARPGGNVTGVNFFFQEVVAKRLELLHRLVPEAVRVAVLLNPANATSTEATLRQAQEAARAIGLQINVLKASTSHEIDAAFASLEQDRLDALFVAGDAFSPVKTHQQASLAWSWASRPADRDPTQPLNGRSAAVPAGARARGDGRTRWPSAPPYEGTEGRCYPTPAHPPACGGNLVLTTTPRLFGLELPQGRRHSRSRHRQ